MRRTQAAGYRNWSGWRGRGGRGGGPGCRLVTESESQIHGSWSIRGRACRYIGRWVRWLFSLGTGPGAARLAEAGVAAGEQSSLSVLPEADRAAGVVVAAPVETQVVEAPVDQSVGSAPVL